MNKDTLKVLLIEDDEDDYILTSGLLNEVTETEYAVTEQENPHEHSRLVAGARLPEGEGKDEEEYDAFEKGFVKLARMAGEGAAGREDHRPRHVRLLAPQLAIHEVGEAAEKQPEGYAAGDEIMDAQP